MKSTHRSKPILLAIGAAALYGLSAPAAKGLLTNMHPVLLAAMLYLGAGLGMLFLKLVGKKKETIITPWKKRDATYVLLMIALDVAAPILLLFGLQWTTSANAALLNNFEIVATTLIAAMFFREAIGKKTIMAIAVITLSSALLSLEDASALTFSFGSILVLLAATAWGLENNCTRMLSQGDPGMVVIVKGLGSGMTSLLIAFALKEANALPQFWIYGLLLGFVAYGLSILFYVRAQRDLGAAKTSAYYAVAPFIGAALSFVFWREALPAWYVPALLLMMAGTAFSVIDQLKKKTEP